LNLINNRGRPLELHFARSVRNMGTMLILVGIHGRGTGVVFRIWTNIMISSAA
jgi:hypothetical protein